MHYTTGHHSKKKYWSLVFYDNRNLKISESKKSEQYFRDKIENFILLFDEHFARHFESYWRKTWSHTGRRTVQQKLPPPRCALRTFGSDRKAAKFRTQGDKFRVIRTRFRFDEEKFRFGEKKYHFDETNFRLHETKFRLLRCNNCKVSPLKQRCDLSQKKAMIVNQIVELMDLLWELAYSLFALMV